MAAMKTFAAKHAAKIRGTLSCFDRVLFRGYLPLMSGWAMADFLWSKQIDRKKLKPFLLEQAERIKKHAGVMASRSWAPYQYLSEPARKEDLARKIAERDGISEGLVCVFSVVRAVPDVLAGVEGARSACAASQTQVPAALLLLHGPPARPHPRQGADLVPVPDPGLRQWPRVARAPTRTAMG